MIASDYSGLPTYIFWKVSLRIIDLLSSVRKNIFKAGTDNMLKTKLVLSARKFQVSLVKPLQLLFASVKLGIGFGLVLTNCKQN